MSILLMTFWFLLILSGSNVAGNFQCPSFCTCGSTATTIDCDGTGISTADIESLFTNLPHGVVVFGLSKSTLSNLETKFFSRVLPNIRTLKLESNKLKEVPRNLSGVFPSLEDLNLSSNEIESIESDDFAGLIKLLKLRLDKNKLTKIGANAFKSSTRLKSLFLGSNKIAEISPDAFNGLTTLSNLDLAHNNLETLPKGIFTVFTNNYLQIYLKYNNLKEIPKGLFRKSQSFLFIDFESNQISSIADEAFADCTINVINFKNNSIVNLNSMALTAMNALISVQVFANPIDCNCNIAKILKYFAEKKITNGLLGECATPVEMEKTNFVTIPVKGIDEKLKCTICDLNNTCVNDGKCVPVSKTELKCECLAGYRGSNCEEKIHSIQPTVSTKSGEEDSGTTTYIIIAVVVLIILIILAIVVCLCLRKKRSKRKNVDGEKNDENLLEGGNEMSEKP